MTGPGACAGPGEPGGPVAPERLRAVAENLGQSLADVARTLRDELRAAHAALVAGLAAGDLTAVGQAAHRARNSALMIEARTTLARLRELEATAGTGDLTGARALVVELEPGYASLIDALDELARG